MPITISINAELAIHMIEFSGCLQFSEIAELGRVHKKNPAWASADTLHVVDNEANLSQITHEQLDAVRAHYRTLHQSIEFFLLRRSGWVCESPNSRRVVEYWLRERHSRDGQGTEVFLATMFDDLGELFSQDELEAAKAMSGFIEMMRIDHEFPGSRTGLTEGAS